MNMTARTRRFAKTCRSMNFALMVAFLSFGAISGCGSSNEDNDWFGAGDSDGSDGGLGAVDSNAGIYPNPQNIAPFVGDGPRKLQFWDLTYSWTDDPDGGTGTCTKGNVQIMNDELQVTQTAAACPDNIGQVTPCNPQAGEDDQGNNVVASGAVRQSAKGCIRDGQGVANCSATPVSGPTDALTCQQAVEREDPLAAGAVWYQRLAGIPPGTSANYWWGKAFGAQGGEANTYGGTQMVYWGDSESAISVAASGGGEYSKEVQPIYMCNSATADVTNTDACGLSSLFGTCLKDGQNCRINNLTEDADGFFNVYFKSAAAASDLPLLDNAQCDVPSGLAWLGNIPKNGVVATWAKLYSAGFKGVVLDIGRATDAGLKKVKAAQGSPTIVLSIANSVTDWKNFTLPASWETKIDKYASAIALDTEKAAPSDCTWMNQQGFIEAFQHRNLLIVIDKKTCQEEFRELKKTGGWKIKFIGDAYSTGNRSAIAPCTDVVQTMIYPTPPTIPFQDIDPVLILNQCPTAAGMIFFDCTEDYPCEASNISSYTAAPQYKAGELIMNKRSCVNFSSGPTPPPPTPTPTGSCGLPVDLSRCTVEACSCENKPADFCAKSSACGQTSYCKKGVCQGAT